MLTPAARRLLEPAVDAAISEEKATYRDRLLMIQAVFQPPLSNAELSDGLGLPGLGVGSEVARFLSTKPRFRRARPDRATRVLIDALLGGELLIGAHAGDYGERREVLVCTAQDAGRLSSRWVVMDVGAGQRIPTRSRADWDSPDLWDLFGDSADVVEPGDAEPRSVLGRRVFPIGLGCMRLSTGGLSEQEGIEVLHAALDAGVRLLDTADVYCTSEDDLHANERLLAAALGSWSGPADEVLVVTKAGLARPEGRWLPDGRPERLRASAEGSLAALGLECLPLMQLHAVDPRVPLADSVGELQRLREEGLVGAIGLCNVTVEQLQLAREHAEIDALQVELHPFTRTGWPLVVEALRQGIPLLAHSPLGGHRRRGRVESDPVLAELAGARGVSPHQVALAVLLDLAPNLVPLAGATRVASVTDSTRAAGLLLGDAERHTLRQRFSWLVEAADAISEVLPHEVVLISGSPASGKTTRTGRYLARGYRRLNRDELGGRLDDLIAPLEDSLAAGSRRVVLDNTYPTRRSRAPVVAAAAAAGVPARLEHVEISESDALVNAAQRMLERQGKLLSPDELKQAARSDPNMLPPVAIRRFFESFEAPSVDEGFASVRVVPFVRRPAGAERALLLDYDGTLRTSTGPAPYPRGPEDVQLLPGRREVLDRAAALGWRLLGVSNQSGVAGGAVSLESVRAAFERTHELLGHDLEVRFCPHPSGRIRCWCRKPMPGMGVEAIRAHGLDPARCLMVGDMPSDEAFAGHLGIPFVHAERFFAPGAAERWLADPSS